MAIAVLGALWLVALAAGEAALCIQRQKACHDEEPQKGCAHQGNAGPADSSAETEGMAVTGSGTGSGEAVVRDVTGVEPDSDAGIKV